MTENKTAMIAAAISQMVQQFGTSIDEGNRALEDLGLQMARLRKQGGPDAGVFGKPRHGQRNRPSKLSRRIKTSC